MTRLEKLIALREGIDYPNVDTKKHREAVRDFLVLVIDEMIAQEQPIIEMGNLNKNSIPVEPTAPANVTTPQPGGKS